MKNAIFALVLIITAVSLATAYFKSQTAGQAVGDLEKERYLRMVAEEDLLKATEKVESLEARLDSVTTQLESNEKLLKQAMSVKNDIQKKYDKVSEMNDALEKQITDLSKRVSQNAAVSTGEI